MQCPIVHTQWLTLDTPTTSNYSCGVVPSHTTQAVFISKYHLRNSSASNRVCWWEKQGNLLATWLLFTRLHLHIQCIPLLPSSIHSWLGCYSHLLHTWHADHSQVPQPWQWLPATCTVPMEHDCVHSGTLRDIHMYVCTVCHHGCMVNGGLLGHAASRVFNCTSSCAQHHVYILRNVNVQRGTLSPPSFPPSLPPSLPPILPLTAACHHSH